MYETGNFIGGADFRSLAETPPPTPEKTPEKLDLDDDDDSETIEDKKPSVLEELVRGKQSETEDKAANKETTKDEQPEKEEDTTETPDQDTVEQDTADDETVDAELAELAPDEEPLAAADYVDARKEELPAEKKAAEPGSEANVKAVASEVFIHAVGEGLVSGKPVDEALAAAEAKAYEAAGVEMLDDDEEETEDEEAAVKAETPPEKPEETPADDTVETPPPPPETALPLDADAEEIDDDDPTIPPTPPTPPVPPIIPGGPTGGSGSGAGGGAYFNRALRGTNPNHDPSDTHDRHSHAPYVLAGGLVGYLLGRRRGRIKTERKLLPVQHSLEKQVADLQQKIAWREMTVRNAVWEQMHKKPEQQRVELATKAPEVKTTHAQELEERRREQLGKLAFINERPAGIESFNPEKPKAVERMTQAEMMEIAEHIPLEDSNMKRLFEAGRLNDEGLRRIITAYLRGEKIDQLLRENVIDVDTHERLPQSTQNVHTGAVLDPVQQVVANEAPHAQDLHDKLRQVGMDTPAPFAQWTEEKKEQKQKHTTLIATITAAVVIAVVIILLWLR